MEVSGGKASTERGQDSKVGEDRNRPEVPSYLAQPDGEVLGITRTSWRGKLPVDGTRLTVD